MKKIIMRRGAGKTTELINLSAETGYYIVTPTRERADWLFKYAQELGKKIPFPISFGEYMAHKPIGCFAKNILIDDADTILSMIFSGLTIKAITMTDENTEGNSPSIQNRVSIKTYPIRWGGISMTEVLSKMEKYCKEFGFSFSISFQKEEMAVVRIESPFPEIRITFDFNKGFKVQFMQSSAYTFAEFSILLENLQKANSLLAKLTALNIEGFYLIVG